MDSNEHNRSVDSEGPLPLNELTPQPAPNSTGKRTTTIEGQKKSMATPVKKTPIVIDLTVDDDEDKNTHNETGVFNNKKSDKKPVPKNLPLTASNGPVEEITDPEHLRRIMEYEQRLDREEAEAARKVEEAKKKKAAARSKRR